jgi:hypothetical protein
MEIRPCQLVEDDMPERPQNPVQLARKAFKASRAEKAMEKLDGVDAQPGLFGHSSDLNAAPSHTFPKIQSGVDSRVKGIASAP